jgi:hypothetical protein
MTDRHYTDDEVAAIFRVAAEGSESRALPSGHADGLTLRDLQSIAREVGIAPDAVADAARSLDRPLARPASRTFLGLPIAVERTVALDRRLTDAEWELLVVELREVFNARGTLRAQGSLREWSNGNLHAFLEPTTTGHRLRLGTFKGSAPVSVAAGVVAVAMSAASGAAAAANGTLSQAALGIVVLASAGAALLANGTLRLPGWARMRSRQIDGIVERLTMATHDDHGSEEDVS